MKYYLSNYFTNWILYELIDGKYIDICRSDKKYASYIYGESILSIKEVESNILLFECDSYITEEEAKILLLEQL